MPKSYRWPLILFNGAFLVCLFTVGPTYGWLPIIAIGAVVSAVNVYALRSLR